ncbi:MAG: type II toxin-antitoxin system VapC family toxin [Spirochaetota bacterium]
MILLDSCVLLWLAADQERLSEKAVNAIRKHAGKLYVSSITAFELAIKTRKKRLELPMSADAWYEKALRLHGIQEVPISGKIASRSAELPLIHTDPCDRFIIATAGEYGYPVITADSIFRKYPKLKVIW